MDLGLAETSLTHFYIFYADVVFFRLEWFGLTSQWPHDIVDIGASNTQHALWSLPFLCVIEQHVALRRRIFSLHADEPKKTA